MMRTYRMLTASVSIVMCVFAASFSLPSRAENKPSGHSIDLDAPGALESLQQNNPKHYRAALEALRVAEKTPCKKREIEALKTHFDINELSCAAALATTHPPKRKLSFSLDGTTYRAVVTITDTIAEFKQLDSSKH